MKVTCASCGTTYLIDEKKIPPSGGKITCSRCGHINIVQPKSRRTAPRLQRLSTMTKLSQLRGDAPKDIPPPVADLDDGKGQSRRELPEDITENLAAKKRGEVVNASPSETTSDSTPSIDHANIWKLKSPSGLIYDFSSLHDLRKWARGRGNITLMQISRDGDTWKRYDEYSHLMRLTAPRLEIPGGASLGKGDIQTSGGSLTSFSDKSVSIAQKLAETPVEVTATTRNSTLTTQSAMITKAHVLPAESGFTFNVPSFLIGLLAGAGILFLLVLFGVIRLAS